MLFAVFFHDMKRRPIPEDQHEEEYRAQHVDKFAGVPEVLRYLDGTLPRGLWSSLFVDDVTRATILAFADWMVGASSPDGSQREASQIFAAFALRLDHCAKLAAGRRHLPLNADLVSFCGSDVVSCSSSLGVVAENEIVARAAAKVLSVLTGRKIADFGLRVSGQLASLPTLPVLVLTYSARSYQVPEWLEASGRPYLSCQLPAEIDALLHAALQLISPDRK